MKLIRKMLALLITTAVMLQMSVSMGIPAGATLLDIPTVYATLELEGTQEEIGRVPLSYILANLKFAGTSSVTIGESSAGANPLGLSAGDPIPIDPDSKAVWVNRVYGYKENFYYRNRECFVMDNSDVIDLTHILSVYDSEPFEIIVGNGRQLGPDNVRYVVTPHMRYSVRYDFDFSIVYNGEDRGCTIAKSWDLGDHELSSEYLFGFNELVAKQDSVNVTITSHLIDNASGNEVFDYGVDSYEKSYNNDSYQIPSVNGKKVSYWIDKNLNGFSDSNAGSINTVMSYIVGGKTVLEKDVKIGFIGNKFFADMFLASTATPDRNEVTRNSYYRSYSPDTCVYDREGRFMLVDCCTNFYAGKNESSIYSFFGFSRALSDEKYGLDSSGLIKIAEGKFFTLEEAENAPDIREQIVLKNPGLPEDTKYYTLFYNDPDVPGGIFSVRLILEWWGGKGGGDIPYDYEKLYDNFNINGVKTDNGVALSSVKMIGGFECNDENYDKYYGSGYVTLMIDETNAAADMSKLILDADVGAGVSVYNALTGERINSFAAEPQNFSDGTVQYTVSDGISTNNFFVTVLKKQTGGAKLFVNGPGERIVHIDANDQSYAYYYGRYHEILIANLGDRPLTGLRTELINAEHIKLDKYWTIGGAGNDTLGAFPDKVGAKMNNLAKIALVSDGEGEIGGTLVIYADGQAPVSVELSGFAGSMNIVTSYYLPEAVKYVPYSAIISTNAVSDTGNTTFSLSGGDLPAGVSLNGQTGELYGVPKETGKFIFYIKAYNAEYDLTAHSSFELVIADNSSENVYNASDENYELLVPIGAQSVSGDRTFYLENADSDQLLLSNGAFSEFIDLWLNGERLARNTDYTAEEGSTKIIVKSQTLQRLTPGSTNTIAAEFRVGGSVKNELKRTAQNFVIGPAPGGGAGYGPGSSYAPSASVPQGSAQKEDGTSGNTDCDTDDEAGIAEENGGSVDGVNADDADTEYERDDGGVVLEVAFGGKIVDTAGRGISGLSVEIHSDVKKASTDKSGRFKVEPLEFGKHKLIVKNNDTGERAEKDFTITESDKNYRKGDVIGAVNGSDISLTIMFDGSSLSFVSDDYRGSVYDDDDVNAPTSAEYPLGTAAAAFGMLIFIILIRPKKKV